MATTIILKRPDGRTVQAPLKVDTSHCDDKAAPAPLDVKQLRSLLDADDDDTIVLSREPAAWEPIVIDDDDPEVSSTMVTPGDAVLLVDVVPGKAICV